MRKAMLMALGAGLVATAAVQFPSSAPALNTPPHLSDKGAIVERTGVIMMPQKQKPGKAAKKAQKTKVKKM